METRKEEAFDTLHNERLNPRVSTSNVSREGARQFETLFFGRNDKICSFTGVYVVPALLLDKKYC